MKYIFLIFTSVILGQLVWSQDSISVLWIGNSYTFVNDLPTTTSDLALSLNKKITFQSKTNGGYTFQLHANDPQTYASIHLNPWDVVVIQGQSQEPSFPYDQVNSESIPYAQRIADSAYQANPCGNVMYFMSWGREVGDPQWDSINTFDKMNQRLYDAYLRIADSSHSAMVSAVGAVWKYVRDNNPSIGLYAGDGSHPSLAGTYIAACTFYASLFRSSPVGASYLGGLDAQTALIIQQAAATVILPNLTSFHLHAVKDPTFANFHLLESGQTVTTQNLSAQGVTYNWNFGDGFTASSENATHSYTSIGTYSVQLIANGQCNADTAVQQITIQSLGVMESEMQSVSGYAYDGGFILMLKVPVDKLSVYSLSGSLIFENKNKVEACVQIPTEAHEIIVHFIGENGVAQQIKLVR